MVKKIPKSYPQSYPHRADRAEITPVRLFSGKIGIVKYHANRADLRYNDFLNNRTTI